MQVINRYTVHNRYITIKCTGHKRYIPVHTPIRVYQCTDDKNFHLLHNQQKGIFSMTTLSTDWAESLPRRIGRAEFIKHLRGKRLSARQRINAACCRCSSGYDTGNDCRVLECPLQPLNPYVLKKNKGDLSDYGGIGE